MASAAVPTDPMPIVPIAKATIPLNVNPVNKLNPVNKGRAFALLALLAALVATKNKTNSAIKATIESGWNKVRPFYNMKSKNQGRWWIKGEEDNEDLIDYIHTWLDHWVTYVEETVFDVNVLPIDEQNCIVNGYNKKVFDAFDRHGVTPHIINFRHRYFWDGGLHCITSDIHREGEMKTFF